MAPENLGRKILKSVLSFALATQGSVGFAASPALIPSPTTTPSADQRDVINDVASQLKRISGTKASFCFAVQDESVTGYNENDPVRTASVTKTLTTFWAIESHQDGPNFQYATKIYYQPSNHEMHIEGQRDPFFDRDRIFALIADLNRKGVTKIDRLTIDSNFWFWPDATELRYLGGGGGGRRGKGGKHSSGGRRGHAGSRRRRHAMIETVTNDRAPASFSLGSPAFKHFVESETHTDQTKAGDERLIVDYLRASLNTSRWNAGMKSRYQRSRSLNPVLGLPDSVSMEVSSIDIVQPSNNPLKGKPGVYEFVVKSAPIKTYLKLMNIWSINPYAEEIFFSLGGKDQFKAFMQNRYGFGSRVSNVNTGSGVNLHGQNRDDSTVSCSTVVQMLRRLDEDLETKWHSDLSDVLSVPGNDGGTWTDASKTLVVKTGTLNHPTASKNLAGVEETTDGEVYFGIFIDRRGGNKYYVQKVLSAMRSNFKGIQVEEDPYQFSPLGAFTHMTLVTPAVTVAKK